MKQIPLLITSAIKVSAPFVAITHQDDRVKYTINGLEQWNRIQPDLKIVVCDGSGFDLKPLLMDNNKIFTENIEFLHFNNNRELVSKLGKGFGEGEIVKFALENSSFINRAHYFSKCTSKLWVENYQECVEGFNGQINLLKRYNDWRLTYAQIDTRFYISELNFYRNNFSDCYQEVNDVNGRFLQHVFADVVKRKNIKNVDFREKPLIFGYSGSVGVYRQTKAEGTMENLKRTVRRLLT